jgi:hypothetical protein
VADHEEAGGEREESHDPGAGLGYGGEMADQEVVSAGFDEAEGGAVGRRSGGEIEGKFLFLFSFPA